MWEVNTKNKDDAIIPVIYQPRMDDMKNFLRQVHCYPLRAGEVEVTLVFNDEHLRRNKGVDWIYRIFRTLRYGRTRDVESFKILKTSNKFSFPNIYSEEQKIDKDDQHADGKPDIKYYYDSYKHPIVFVNTANHALKDGDNNHELWKFEYAAWEEFTPIHFGNLDRTELDGLSGLKSLKDSIELTWKHMTTKNNSEQGS
ncbi:MAG: hypothetical protein OEQ12_04820 [Nitrosopumilus sp.]|nr:hypothetical protein [Nitrosopumilus sp.]